MNLRKSMIEMWVIFIIKHGTNDSYDNGKYLWSSHLDT